MHQTAAETRHFLALDIATTTGWASWRDGAERPQFGAVTFPSGLAEFADAFETWLLAKIIFDGITHIVFEASYPSIGRTSFAVALRLNWSHVNVLKIGFARSIPAEPVGVSEWRQFFIKCSRAPKSLKKSKRRAWLKAASIAECRRRGWDVGSSDDAADALGLLSYALNQCDREKIIPCDTIQKLSGGENKKSSLSALISARGSRDRRSLRSCATNSALTQRRARSTALSRAIVPKSAKSGHSKSKKSLPPTKLARAS